MFGIKEIKVGYSLLNLQQWQNSIYGELLEHH